MDIKILFPSGAAVDLNTTLAADLSLVDGLFETDASLYTATVISLFTDARAGKDDELPATETFRRGWWGDGVPSAGVPAGDRIGSRLWLLSREKQLPEVLARAKHYAEESLQWLLDDGRATDVAVTATNPQMGWLALEIIITLPDGNTYTDKYNYQPSTGFFIQN